MHAPGKGISQSALPYRRSVPQWLKLTSDEVKDQIFKLAKKGLTPSQIGVILRDSHGVAQVRFITGNKILRILKGKGMAPELPEDCYYLIKKAVSIRFDIAIKLNLWATLCSPIQGCSECQNLISSGGILSAR